MRNTRSARVPRVLGGHGFQQAVSEGCSGFLACNEATNKWRTRSSASAHQRRCWWASSHSSSSVPKGWLTCAHFTSLEAAKSGASALKQFQPTLRELSQVSNELRTNITNEMGLDELQRDIRDLRDTTRSTFSTSSTPTPTPTPTQPATSSGDEARGKGGASSNGASSDGSAAKGGTAGKGALGMDGEEKRALREISEGLASMDERQASAAKAGSSADVALAEDPDIERKRRESAAMAWGGNVPQQLSASDEGAAPTVAKGGEKKRLEDMTMAELEAELAKRKALVDRIKASKA